MKHALLCRKLMKLLFRYATLASLSVLLVIVLVTLLRTVSVGRTRASGGERRSSPWTCPTVLRATTNVSTFDEFPSFQFQEDWIGKMSWWNEDFESRFLKAKSSRKNRTLKIIVVPHSHNDPGWLKTFEEYYHQSTKKILDNMMKYLTKNQHSTFIWTEISYLAKWWKDTSVKYQDSFKQLLKDGKIEITTGGWVMTDEATVNLYSMIHQLVEGHQWVKHHLNFHPKSSWSIDPFGHGATFPYLLKSSGIENMVIQRIHYAWKKWFASNKANDFIWRQSWDAKGRHDILCHNMPYDIYSIKHSCGPFPEVCLSYDFRKLPFELTESGMVSVPIDRHNVEAKAETLLEQYERTASLSDHDVLMVIVGDDFRYDHQLEWNQQFGNYKMIIDYLQERSSLYNVNISFGTLSDYFEEVRDRADSMLSIQGDFMPYSDVFTSGEPAYWTGYYTTRPYMKALVREVEHSLRAAEILFSLAVTNPKTTGNLASKYGSLVEARRNLALFQHHDAITGTSRAAVMHDYGEMLHSSLQIANDLQALSSQLILSDGLQQTPRMLFMDHERNTYDRYSTNKVLSVSADKPQRITLFNSHPHTREEVVRVLVPTVHVRISDSEGRDVPFQVNPLWSEELTILDSRYEAFFLAVLPPLSFASFLVSCSDVALSTATVYSSHANQSRKSDEHFQMKRILDGDIKLENEHMKVVFCGKTRLLKYVEDKRTGRSMVCSLKFAAYNSENGASGAYLFKPTSSVESDVLWDMDPSVFVTSGKLFTEFTAVFGNVLVYSMRIYNVGSDLSRGIYLETLLDMSRDMRFLNKEFILRFLTDLSTDVLHTDSNGFQMIRRKHVPSVGLEGNYYPVTNLMFLEEGNVRLNLVVSRAHGAAVWNTGILELMLDRRTAYDDRRGMGESVLDQRKTLSKFWLLLESAGVSGADGASRKGSDAGPGNRIPNPSSLADYLSTSLNYPPLLFVVSKDYSSRMKQAEGFLSAPFPCDTELVSLRSLADSRTFSEPSRSVLMTVHRKGQDCRFADGTSAAASCEPPRGDYPFPDLRFPIHQVESLELVTLTGLRSLGRLQSFRSLRISPQELQSLNVTFR